MAMQRRGREAFQGAPVSALTRGPDHYFFGYYDKSPWDRSGRYVLGMRVKFMDRPNRPDDIAELGVIDTAEGNGWRTFAQTTAWCWQQGAMLQWLPGSEDRVVVYNQREGGRFVAVVQDVFSGERRALPRPVYALSPDGRTAATLNFSRLATTRPGYGYAGVPDAFADESHPADDGVWVMDMASGESRLIVSMQAMAQLRPSATMAGRQWVNHLLFSRDGRRLALLHRWPRDGGLTRYTRLLTVNVDGSGLWLLNGDEMTSHYDWRNSEHILAWAHRADHGDRYYLFRDRTHEAAVWGEGVLDSDGHCSFSPDDKWVLTDGHTFPGHRTLMLYEIATNRRFDIGFFRTLPELTGEIRCDLHPRWRRDGKRVCIDSAHEGTRQMYEVDVSGVVGNA